MIEVQHNGQVLTVDANTLQQLQVQVPLQQLVAEQQQGAPGSPTSVALDQQHQQLQQQRQQLQVTKDTILELKSCHDRFLS